MARAQDLRDELRTKRRQGAARILGKSESVVPISDTEFWVLSETGLFYYTVIRDGYRWLCDCPDNRGGHECKHVEALLLTYNVLPEPVVESTSFPLDLTPMCPTCASVDVVKNGARKCNKGTVQRFLCRSCGAYFTPDLGFNRLRATPEKVVAAYSLWATGNMSYRQIAKHFEVIGEPVGKSTVERWVRRMGEFIHAYAEHNPPQVGKIWHADETTVNVNGSLLWTWNVMDAQTRLWLGSLITEGREIDDAVRALKQAQRNAGGVKPQNLITDGGPFYIRGVTKAFYDKRDPTRHLVLPPIRSIVHEDVSGAGGAHPGNNIVERLQETQRGRTRPSRSFKGKRNANKALERYRDFYNLARPHMGLDGMTPGEAAGIAMPSLENGNRVMALVVAGKKEMEE